MYSHKTIFTRLGHASAHFLTTLPSSCTSSGRTARGTPAFAYEKRRREQKCRREEAMQSVVSYSSVSASELTNVKIRVYEGEKSEGQDVEGEDGRKQKHTFDALDFIFAIALLPPK